MKVANRVVLPSAQALTDRMPTTSHDDMGNSYARISRKRGNSVTLDRPLMGDTEWHMGDLQMLSESLSDFTDEDLALLMFEVDQKAGIG